MSYAASAPFARLPQELITASTTWTKPPRLRPTDIVQVELWGGGGGGGDESYGMGGGYCVHLFAASEIPATVEIEIGAGGNGSGYNPGGDGGNTLFGSLMTAPGGKGSLDKNAPLAHLQAGATEQGGHAGWNDGVDAYDAKVYWATRANTFKSGAYGNSGSSQFGGSAGQAPGGGGVWESSGAAGQAKITYL